MKASAVPRVTSRKGLSRRRFLGSTLGAAALVWPVTALPQSARRITTTRIEGVDIGVITYSYRELAGGAEEILGYVLQNGLATVELMGNTAEEFAGAPERPPMPNWREMSDQERADFRRVFQAHAEAVSAWRKSAPMERFEALGRMYADAGVRIDILKLGDPRWSDGEIDYAFTAARAVGARGICFEISNEGAERIAPFADKHEALVALHHHTQVAEEGFSWEIPLSYSPYNRINFDVGHYFAATGASPVAFMEKYHDRISHLHLKDREQGMEGRNLPWGQGETPLVEILQFLKRTQYPIPAMIELEYEVPEGSDVLTEVSKCVAFCREALAS